ASGAAIVLRGRGRGEMDPSILPWWPRRPQRARRDGLPRAAAPPSLRLMLSRRLPSERTPNAWARALEARHAVGGAVIDLTEANPTRVGLSGADDATLAALAAGAAEAARYEPDPRGLP